MSEKAFVKRYCDHPLASGSTCGTEISSPVRYSFGSAMWESDLCDDHVRPLRELVAQLSTATGRRVSSIGPMIRRKEIPAPNGQTFTTAMVRQWLRDQGRPVPESGRIKPAWEQEYVAHHFPS